MTVSDEAVEAAYQAHLEYKSVRSPGNAKNAIRAALEAAAPHMVESERVRAAIRLLYPDEMTPTAKRILERILEESE